MRLRIPRSTNDRAAQQLDAVVPNPCLDWRAHERAARERKTVALSCHGTGKRYYTREDDQDGAHILGEFEWVVQMAERATSSMPTSLLWSEDFVLFECVVRTAAL